MCNSDAESATLALAKELISRASVTPEDAGCQRLIAERLAPLGFVAEHLRFGEVDNLWLRRGTEGPLFVFAGHTDVVPAGPLELWDSPPFEPTLRDGMLYGRGAADMKGSLAAMVTACEQFLRADSTPRGSIALLLTSDEEGPSINGTVKVVEWLQARGTAIDWCVVGEPSSSRRLADTVKHGRRGSLSGTLTVHGTQGHVAYPELAENPIHCLAPALAELCARRWDEGTADFPPTTFQVSNIQAGTGATNVIPGSLQAQFNFRHSTATTQEQLRIEVEQVLQRHGLRYTLQWTSSGQPFLTRTGELLDAVRAAAEEVVGIVPQASTAGGTSDGRFIAPTGAQVVELGPVNASIHKVNECVAATDLDDLARIYQGVLARLVGSA
ncbi:succinyl-diaminopimelate desuccinylase [Ectothiorhodospiraceae bacterium 2226]|nr:succinyl-diaminopimelate desuccinylase [Ectothiorhodospiraceae bacterium 2226]